MSCVQCSRFPSPSSCFKQIAESRVRHSELVQCIYCGQLIEMVAEERSPRLLSEGEAIAHFGLHQGSFAGAVDYERIGRLSAPIAAILIAELKRGNRIVETSVGWPVRGVFVMLRSDFGQSYHESGLEYTELNDPHYWRNQYVDTASGNGIGSRM